MARGTRGDLEIARRVARYGLRVRCLGCDATSRHKTGEGTRLRDKTCPRCGSVMRPEAWFKRFPDRAIEQQRAARFELTMQQLEFR